MFREVPISYVYNNSEAAFAEACNNLRYDYEP